MNASLHDPQVRAAFLAALEETGLLTRAAAAVGVRQAAPTELRRIDPEFRAATDAARQGRGGALHYAPYRACNAERRRAFLARLATHGNVSRACREIGMPVESFYKIRRRDADFAAAWASARTCWGAPWLKGKKGVGAARVSPG